MTAFKTTVSNTVNNLRARFYTDDITGREMVEIGFKGNLSTDTSIARVTPEHIAKFPAEYQAFKLQAPDIDIGGTPLMDLPGMIPDKMRHYKLNGIRNAEELAGISDAVCANVGLGALTDRTIARNHLAAKQLEALQAAQVAQANAVNAKLSRNRSPEAAN